MVSDRSASAMVKITDDTDVLEVLRKCGGYYECPEGGLLVGYAGTYNGPDNRRLQFVGHGYANFAMAEENPHVLKLYADGLGGRLAKVIDAVDVFCGAPMGGICLSQHLGLVCDRKAIYAEKRVTELATANQREQSELVFNRHEPKPGNNVVIVEDVVNNATTTGKLISLIEGRGA